MGKLQGGAGSFRHEVADQVAEIVRVQRFQQAFGHQGNGGDLRLANVAERHRDGFGRGLQGQGAVIFRADETFIVRVVN